MLEEKNFWYLRPCLQPAAGSAAAYLGKFVKETVKYRKAKSFTYFSYKL